MTSSATTEEPPKVFVGFLRLQILDSDGLPKRVNGCCYQVPVHATENDDTMQFDAHFPPDDPIKFLRMTNESSELLAATWWHGTWVNDHDPIPLSKTLATLESCYCRKKLAEVSSDSFSGIAHCPLVGDTFNKPLAVTVRVTETKFQKRVTRVTMTMDKKMFEEFKVYYEALKAFDKDKDKDKDKNDKKDEAEGKNNGPAS